MIRINKLTWGCRALTLVFLTLALPNLSEAASWQWMAPQRAHTLVKEGSGLWLVDVRNERAFTEGHVEGAILIPASTIAGKHVPKGKIIVLVDDSLGLRQARSSAEILLGKGCDKVFLLEGGMSGWLNEGYPVAGKGNSRSFRSVLPEDVDWALDNHISLKIFDLRETSEQEPGPVRDASSVAGKSLAERLEKVKAMLSGAGKNALAAQLEKPATTILVFPAATDPRPVLERSFRGVPGDLRFMEGGYAAWASKQDKSFSTMGGCPTCPKVAPGGKK
jgi:rhodanese-related sulfurtransferase